MVNSLTFAFVIHRLFLITFLLIASTALAQEQAKGDTIPLKPKVSAFSSTVFQADNRREHYYDTKGRMLGVKLGVELFNRHRMGLGYYRNSHFENIPYPNKPIDVIQTHRLNYTVGFFEFVWFRNFRWEYSISASLGRGNLSVNTFATQYSEPTRSYIRKVNAQDYCFNMQYKVVSWFGFGLGLGYRNAQVPNHPELSKGYSNTYYDIRIKLFPGYIYKAIYQPKKILHEKAFYSYRKQQRKAYLKKLLFNGR
jgi:hypothetical protein